MKYKLSCRVVVRSLFENKIRYAPRALVSTAMTFYSTGCLEEIAMKRLTVRDEKGMGNIDDIKFSNFKWLNEPSCWSLDNDVLRLKTDNSTDFWQETWYNFNHNTGHIYGVEIRTDFTIEVCIEAEFTTLYDQAGLMIYVDDKHWLKAGIEYNEGQPMIGSVLTNEVSDWATGVYTGNPRKFWLRLSKVGSVVCVKYSTDNLTWTLLRLSYFPVSEKYFVGPMSCTPQREGLIVTFSDMRVRSPQKDILHSN